MPTCQKYNLFVNKLFVILYVLAEGIPEVQAKLFFRTSPTNSCRPFPTGKTGTQ